MMKPGVMKRAGTTKAVVVRTVVAGVLAAAAMAASAPATMAIAASPPPTITRGQLTVGVSLPSEGFEVGVARGTDVIYAQGFDIDLARAVAKSLGLSRVQFVQSPFGNLLSSGKKPWDIAVAQITITTARSHNISFSQPYMTVDQGVLAAKDLSPVPTSLAGLRGLQLCALQDSTGADVAFYQIAPDKPLILPNDVPTLMLDLQTGICQAVVYDAPTLGALKAMAPTYYGTFVGLVPTGEHYGIALPKDSPLRSRVNAAVATLLSDGTVRALEKKWFTADLANVPVLH